MAAAFGGPRREFGEHRHDTSHPLWGVFGTDPRGADLDDGEELLRHLGSWLAAKTDAAPEDPSA